MPQHKNIVLIILIISSFFSIPLKAQVKKIDSLGRNLFNYSTKSKSSLLFVHFDKNVYTNNDQVWFTGYLLNTVANDSLYNMLYLTLVNDQDTTVNLQHKFLIDKGYAYGSFTLPDSLRSGSYRFVLNTNIKINGQPDGEFIQPVTIKSTIVNPLVSTISLLNAEEDKTGTGKVLLKTITSDNRFIEDAEIEYVIGKKGQIIRSGKAKTSVIGEYTIDYPIEKISDQNNVLSVTIKKGKNIRHMKLDLPYRNKNKYKVNFYPEGGYLVSGLQSKIGFEIKNESGAGVKAKGILFENSLPIDTISTSSLGLGSFNLNIKANINYSFKLLEDGKLIGTYNLPKAQQNGVVLRLNSASGNNELSAFIESNNNTNVYLIVHNGEKISLSSSLTLIQNNRLKVRLKLDSVPIGLNTITILDSEYHPLAERIFFAHSDEIAQLQIETNKSEFKTREPVNLKLKAFGKNTNQIKSVVSISVVQANRISSANKSNIVDYTYLDHDLKGLQLNLTGIKYNDLNYLEDVLLIKGWRKYKWPEEENVEVNEKEFLSHYDLKGSITRNKKPIKKPIPISVIAGRNLTSFNTDSIGAFIIPYKSQITDSLENVWLNLGVTNHDAYTVEIKDPLDDLKAYIKHIDYQSTSSQMDILSFATEKMTSLSGIKLNDVTIRKNKDEINFIGRAGSNKCGDYVCMYNILNCKNHIGNGTIPIVGKTYFSNGRVIVYQGCYEQKNNPNLILLKSILLAKEFYVSDINNKNEPINFSTVYWNYQTFINNTGETMLSFNTGDLTGNFKIIVQGVTEHGVIYGEKDISITRP
jgi:hypothetical protein